MRNFLSAVAAVAVVLASQTSFAKVNLIDGANVADDIQLGEPAYGGTGCPAGSASVSLSPDQKTLSLLFDQYVVEAGGTTGKTLDRKTCNIAIPVRVPHGYSISLIKVDYRGFNFLPRGANARFTAEYFFAGSRGPITSRSFFGPTQSDYLFTNNLIAEAIVWSACGANTNLRVNSNMTVLSPRQEQALSTVDSADVEAGIIYQIQWRRCS
ncbi:MAG: DUF4360 domain-containing protein [Bdellovibrionia bacterium]